MLAQLCVQYILILISTLIPLIFGDCITDADQCFDKFKSDLDDQMRHQLDNPETQLNKICHPLNGSFNQFVNCINEVESECHSDKRFRQNICDKRYFKTRVTKFTWKPTFFYELCHNFRIQWSQDLLQHESCINSVLSTPKWKCDVNYERVIKNTKNWKKDISGICSLWQKYRDCITRDMNQKCGADATLISDHLFHSHQSYFEKYYSCNFNLSKFSDECWYDSIKAKATETQTPISSINDMTDTNTDSNKSTNLMTNNDNSSSTQISVNNKHLAELKVPTNPLSEQGHEESLSNGELNEQESNQKIIATEANEVTELKANATNESVKTVKPLKIQQRGSTGSGATTDSIADKYLLIIPLIIIFFLKLLI